MTEDPQLRGRTPGAGRLALFLIDPQNDFHPAGPTWPQGTLPVDGANQDSYHTAWLIEHCGDQIDNIVVSMDSHQRMHISNRCFWTPSPKAFTKLSLDMVPETYQSHPPPGKYQPVRAEWLPPARAYLAQLVKNTDISHTIWPEHCIVGTAGWQVVPPLMAAINKWALNTRREVTWVMKGMAMMTEMFSALKAEVPIPEDNRTWLNQPLIDFLGAHERVLVCGEAMSHCVNKSARDLIENLRPDARCKHVTLIEDATSSVPSEVAMAQALVADLQGLYATQKYGCRGSVSTTQGVASELGCKKMLLRAGATPSPTGSTGSDDNFSPRTRRLAEDFHLDP